MSRAVVVKKPGESWRGERSAMKGCRYHPNAELTRTIEQIKPAFYNGEEKIARTRLRCSMVNELTGLQCPWMTVEYDVDRVDARYCVKCKKRLREDALGNNPVCNACRNSYRKLLTRP